MTLVSERQGDYLAIVEFLESRLASHFTVSTSADIPAGEVAEAHTYFPYNFGDRFPVAGVSELAHEGERFIGGYMDPPAPAVIDVGIRIYHPSLVTDNLGTYEDGRQEARRITRQVYSAGRESFYADEELASMVERITLGRVEAADHDQIGNPFSPDRGNTVLWVHAATARFYL